MAPQIKSTSWNAARGRTNTPSTRGPTQPDTPFGRKPNWWFICPN